MTVEPEWTMELPEAWQTAPFWPERVEVIATVDLPRDRQALLINAMLTDGTCIMALAWDAGQRMARCSPHNGWGVEERFTGRPPGPGEGALIRAWKVAVDAQVDATRRADAELGGRPS